MVKVFRKINELTFKFKTNHIKHNAHHHQLTSRKKKFNNFEVIEILKVCSLRKSSL